MEDENIATELHQLNILYAPDYVINAGGLISVVSEFERNYSEIFVAEKVQNIGKILRHIFIQCQQKQVTTVSIADKIATNQINNRFRSTY